MKYFRRVSFVLLFVIYIYCLYIYAECDRNTEKNIYVASAVGASRGNPFSPDSFADKAGGRSFISSFEMVKPLTVSANMRTIEVRGILTNYEYAAINNLFFINGSFWDERQETLESDIVVINEVLSQKLFGSGDAVGEVLTVQDSEMIIVGIAKEGEGDARVYMPFYSEEENIFFQSLSLMFKFWEENEIDNTVQIKNFFSSLSLDYEGFDAASTNRILLSVYMKFKSLSIIIALCFIWGLSRFALRRARSFIKNASDDFEEGYFLQVLRKNMGTLIFTALTLLFTMLVIMLFFKYAGLYEYIESFDASAFSFKSGGSYMPVIQEVFLSNVKMTRLFWLWMTLFIASLLTTDFMCSIILT